MSENSAIDELKKDPFNQENLLLYNELNHNYCLDNKYWKIMIHGKFKDEVNDEILGFFKSIFAYAPNQEEAEKFATEIQEIVKQENEIEWEIDSSEERPRAMQKVIR